MQQIKKNALTSTSTSRSQNLAGVLTKYLWYRIDMQNHYLTRLQGIRRQGGSVQVYANLPLALAARCGAGREGDLEGARPDAFAVGANQHSRECSHRCQLPGSVTRRIGYPRHPLQFLPPTTAS